MFGSQVSIQFGKANAAFTTNWALFSLALLAFLIVFSCFLITSNPFSTGSLNYGLFEATISVISQVSSGTVGLSTLEAFKFNIACLFGIGHCFLSGCFQLNVGESHKFVLRFNFHQLNFIYIFLDLKLTVHTR